MPRKAARQCAQPGCPNLVKDSKQRYCDEHRQQQQKQYDAQRGTASQRGYGARWRRLRKMFLRAHPICADPYGIHAEHDELVASAEVDHIIPTSQGGTDAWDNLQALCKPCHSRKTALEDGRWGPISI